MTTKYTWTIRLKYEVPNRTAIATYLLNINGPSTPLGALRKTIASIPARAIQNHITSITIVTKKPL